MDTSFEEKYKDVLQNMELALVNTYRAHPEFVDSGALYVVETMIKVYTDEQKGREAKLPDFQQHEQEAFDFLNSMCEWRLGRKPLAPLAMDMVMGKGNELSDSNENVKTLDEIIACLKRIQKSIKMWGKQSASRRAYFNLINKYL